MKNKLLATLVVLALMASSLMVFTTTTVAKYKVDTTGDNANWILSNDGFDTWADNLTCGEVITLQITNNSLTPDTRYKVGVWNGTHWRALQTDGSRTSDMYGDLSISFHVPGWAELGNSTVSKNPVTDNGTGVADSAGQWSISLFHNNFTEGDDYESVQRVFTGLNATIKIGNQYHLEFYEDGEEIDHLYYNRIYNSFQVKIYNWTGDEFELAKDDATKYKFDVNLINYTGGNIVEPLGTDKTGGISDTKGLLIDDNIITSDDLEKTLWVNVNHSTANTGGKWLNSTIALPVLLNVTLPTPPDAVWGDTFTVQGKVLDGGGTGIKSYDVYIYYPVSGGFDYDMVSTPSTVTTGTYSLSFETGSTKGFGAGTWYVGTFVSGATGRVDMSNDMPYMDNFIPYHSFEVGTKDSATVKLENTDDIVKGFTQTINVSVENESWMDGDEFQSMNIHVTGVKGYYGGQEFERTDIVPITVSGTPGDDDESFYEFDYMFNDTGTATVWVSWEGNLTSYENHDSSYSNSYGNHNTSLIANITGTVSFAIGSPDTMTVLVEHVPEEVVKEAACDGGWVNKSTAWTNISVYGNEESSNKNATIEITGCGLDITIEEDDDISDNDYLLDKGWSNSGTGAWYNVSIIPKTAGTLTITVTNDTDTVVKDYAVTGLSGSIATSVNDDLKITVGTTETITLDGISEYAETKITFFDENWDCQALLNESEDSGEFSFTPDSEDIDRVGYIVVVAGITAYDQYMYDIIEVVPVEDITVDVTTPDAGNQTLTVGMRQDIILQLLDDNDDPVTDDDPDIDVTLYDIDGDEVTLLDDDLVITNAGDGEFEIEILPYVAGELKIEGYNASDRIKHNGSINMDVEHATVTYSPTGTTSGLEIEDLTITVTAVDANGNELDDETLYLWAENDSGILAFDSSVDLIEGVGEFDITEVGDLETWINATLQDNSPSAGNATAGKFNVDYPTFTLTPDTIYIGQSNTVEITSTDINGDPIQGINLTFVSSIPGILASQPDPVQTNADGIAELSVSPQASGKLNVTIARNLAYEDGQLNWTNSVITDTSVTVTSVKTMKISISKSPIYEGETLTVTVMSGASPLSGADVEFAETTAQTDSNGEATFTVPDPGVESATYTITAEKSGYTSADKSITVIKVYTVQIVGPTTPPAPGEEFTVSIIANGAALAGATVEFNGNTYTSNARGEITLTAPDSAGSYTVTAAYENYEDGTLTITVDEGDADGVPGFELLTLVAALGVAFILLRRRRQ